MQQQGQYELGGEVDSVWAALNDLQVLAACIPGCESIERIDEANVRVALRAKLGPVNTLLEAVLTLDDLDPPRHYTLRGKVRGSAGMADGEAKVQLHPIELDGQAGTRLSYEMSATVGGKLAQLGGRLIDAAATRMADDFFKRLSLAISSQGVSETASSTERAEDGQLLIWGIAFTVLIAAMILAF